jgi:methionyl-tRNA synthetase
MSEETQENKIEDKKVEVVKNSNSINIEDFAKIDIRVGKILSVEKVPETDKLLKLSVDLGEENPRTIVSGIALYFEDFNVLVGKKCMFVANLEPRILKGIESNGMILAVSTPEGKFSIISPNDEIPVGTRAK